LKTFSWLLGMLEFLFAFFAFFRLGAMVAVPSPLHVAAFNAALDLLCWPRLVSTKVASFLLMHSKPFMWPCYICYFTAPLYFLPKIVFLPFYSSYFLYCACEGLNLSYSLR
jgi:hypothetical protein